MTRSVAIALFFLVASVAFAQTGEELIVGQTREYWTGQLQSPVVDVRVAALRSLSALGEKSPIAAVQIVASALSDSDASVRRTAAYNLRLMGENLLAALEPLTKALDDKDAWVRSSAVDTIRFLREKAEPAVLKIGTLAVKDESASVRVMAAQSLGQIMASPELSVGFLAKALRDPDAGVRLAVAQALSNYGKNADPATLPLALVAANDGDHRVRLSAIGALGIIGLSHGSESKQAIPYLTKCLSDNDPEIRRKAAFALSGFAKASQPAMSDLIETLRDGPPKAQEAAAGTLGSIGPVANSAVPLLLEKLRQERHLQLRNASAGALLRIDPGQLETVVGILTEGTRSKDSGVRMFALQGLLKTAKEPAQIVPVLRELKSDEIVDIRQVATEELARLEEKVDKEAPNQVTQAATEAVSANPKVTLKDATREDSDAALALLRSFLALWQEGKLAEAAEFVDERIRHGYLEEMKKEPMRLRSIDDMTLTMRNGQGRARVHITRSKGGGLGLDMIFRDGKWWIGN